MRTVPIDFQRNGFNSVRARSRSSGTAAACTPLHSPLMRNAVRYLVSRDEKNKTIQQRRLARAFMRYTDIQTSTFCGFAVPIGTGLLLNESTV